ncbi:MAG: hypothetical protein ACODAU_05520, partial [Myxococcota bacterium]
PYLGQERRHALAPLREHRARLAEGPAAPLLARAATPVMLGGLTDGVARMMADALEPFGLHALQAGGGSRRSGGRGRARGEGASFVDGGALGVQLMRGDITATAVGTVTHVGGRRLVAFGHPMLNGGQLGLPTAAARVLHIFKSQSRSFKIAEAVQPRGTMIHDRLSTIVVDQGTEATVVPLTVRLHGVEGAPRDRWRVEIPSHRLLSPALAFAAVSNAVEATASDTTDVVFRARSRVRIAGYGDVEVEDRGYSFAGAGSPAAFGQLRLFDLMEVAYGNPFREARIERAEVDLHVDFSRDVVEIVDASVPATEVDPGATVPLRVVTRRFGEEPRSRVVPLRIPHRAAGAAIEVELLPGNQVDLERPEPGDLDDLVEGVLRRHSSTALVTSIKMPSRGLRFRGHVVRALPASGLDTLQLVNDSAHGRPFVTEERQVVDVGSVLSGSAKLELKVRKAPREGK